MFMELLEKIPLKDSDTLYILGDVVDRGPHPIKTLQKLKKMPNVICMVGNHELMALRCLKLLMTADAQSVFGLDEEDRKDLWMWQYNGGLSTFEEFRELDAEEQQEIIEFMSDFLVYEEVSAGGRDYLLVHAGLGNYLVLCQDLVQVKMSFSHSNLPAIPKLPVDTILQNHRVTYNRNDYEFVWYYKTFPSIQIPGGMHVCNC